MSDDLDRPKATNPTGEAKNEVLHLDFDRRVMAQFRGSVVTPDAGLLAYRELDDVLRLSDLAGELLADGRTGKNGRHALVGMLRQSVFGRLAGYEDVNDADRTSASNRSATPAVGSHTDVKHASVIRSRKHRGRIPPK